MVAIFELELRSMPDDWRSNLASNPFAFLLRFKLDCELAMGNLPPVQAMIAFIDDHREAYGVEPICRVLPIAPSTYHAHAARRADPARRRPGRGGTPP